MKTLLTIIPILFIAALQSNAQQLSKKNELFIDSIMNAQYKSDKPGAVILAAKNGKPVFCKAYGMANLELNVSNKPEYLFCIGSISKQFYAVCLLQLAQEGKLSLEDDIRNYLKDYNSHSRTITISNLLSHTSGIPSFTEKPDFEKEMGNYYSKNEMISSFVNDSLMFDPGTDYSYSNSAYMLAGLIIEKASGMTLENYLQKRIFDVLGMSHTFTGTREKVMAGLVSGYEEGITGFKPASYFSWSWPYGGGYLITCVDDMLKWDEALYGNSILSQEELQKAWTPFVLPNGRKTNYGLGWIISQYKGVQIISHDGFINGFRSNSVRIPSEHLYVIVLTNTMNNPVYISTDIALHLANKPYKMPEPQKIDGSKLQEYSGVFDVHHIGSRASSNYGSEKAYRYITVSNDTIYSQINKLKKRRLINVGRDLFMVDSLRSFIQFNRNKEQKVTSLELYTLPISSPELIELKTSLPVGVDSSIRKE